MARTHLSRAVPRGGPRSDRLRRSRLDPATLLGFASGFGLVVIAMAVGGSPESFFDLPAVMIVVGGTFGVTTICYSVDEIARAYKVVVKVVFQSVTDPERATARMLQLAEEARKNGILALEPAVEGLSNDPFAYKAVAMVVDGSPSEEIELILGRDIEEMKQRHLDSAGIFRRAAEVSPAMGLIGTLIGLVQLLGSLDDPAAIGPSMAIALLTTFYGAVLSSMVFAPLASKLERNSVNEVLVANIYMLAAASIGRKENPRRLELLLNALLPPARRVQHFT